MDGFKNGDDFERTLDEETTKRVFREKMKNLVQFGYYKKYQETFHRKFLIR
jgi:hypothetical protein